MTSPTNPTNPRVIEVIVGPKGETTVQTRGFAGPSCREASRFVEQALGERAAETLSAEFYQPLAQPEQVRQGG